MVPVTRAAYHLMRLLDVSPSEDGMMRVEGVIIFSKGGITHSRGCMMIDDPGGGTNFTEGSMELGMVP